MTETYSTNHIQQRAFFSSIKDGLIELFVAWMMFLVGLMFINILYIFFLVLSRMIWLKLSQKIKIDYIYPRIGVCELTANHKRKLKNYWRIFGFLQSGAVISLFIIVYNQDWKINTLMIYVPIIICAGIVGLFLYFSMFSGHNSYLWLGLISIITAILFVIYPFPTGYDHTIFYAWFESIFLFIIGFVKLYRFLQKNPRINEMEK